jgi:HEPN domain-containing protein
MDKQKHIDYWISGAKEDVITARVLFERGRQLHALFFCHLVIEKAIKAHVVNATNDVAPRSHSLFYLSEKAQIEFDEETDEFLGILMKYQLQGRYPDFKPTLPTTETIKNHIEKTESLLKWLTDKL